MLTLFQAGVVTVSDVRNALNFGADEEIIQELKQIKNVQEMDKSNTDGEVEEVANENTQKDMNRTDAEGAK